MLNRLQPSSLPTATLPLHPPPGPDWPALSSAFPAATWLWWVALPVGAGLLLLAGLILRLLFRAGKTDPIRLLREELTRLRSLPDSPEKLLAAERWLRRLLALHWGDVVFTLSVKELATKLSVQATFPGRQAAQAVLEAAEQYKFASVVPPQAEIHRLINELTTCCQAWPFHTAHLATSRSEGADS